MLTQLPPQPGRPGTRAVATCTVVQGRITAIRRFQLCDFVQLGFADLDVPIAMGNISRKQSILLIALNTGSNLATLLELVREELP